MNEHGKCQEVMNQICEYVEGTLNADLCAELERHLSGCEDCRVVVDTLRKTIELYQKSENETEPLPDAVRERLFACLDIKEFLEKSS